MPPPPKRDLPPYVHQSGNSTYEYRINLPRRPDGTRPKPVRQGGFSDPYDAHRAAQIARRRLGASSPEEIENAGITLIDWCRECMDRKRGMKLSTIKQEQFGLRVIANGRLANVRIDRLRPLDLQNWLDLVADEQAYSTADRALRVITQAMKTAVKLQVLSTNPAASVSVPPAPKRPRVIHTPAQAQQLLKVAQGDEDYALWLLLALMQLRPGEAMALKVDDFDFRRHVFSVRRTLTSASGRGFFVGESAKTASSHRTLDMLQVVEDAVIAHIQRHRQRVSRGLLHPQFLEQGLLFPNRYGGPLTHVTTNRRLAMLCELAGVPVLTGHGMRHTGATWLRHLGVAPEVVARRLGHTNVSMVLNVYSNPLPDDQLRASNTLEQHMKMLTDETSGSGLDTPRQ